MAGLGASQQLLLLQLLSLAQAQGVGRGKSGRQGLRVSQAGPVLAQASKGKELGLQLPLSALPGAGGASVVEEPAWGEEGGSWETETGELGGWGRARLRDSKSAPTAGLFFPLSQDK